MNAREDGPFSAFGGPALAVFANILSKRNTGERASTAKLLEQVGLPDAIRAGAGKLRSRGRGDEAVVMDELAGIVDQWPADFCRDVASCTLAAIQTGQQVVVHEISGDVIDAQWAVAHDGEGGVSLRIPSDFQCRPTALEDDAARALLRRLADQPPS